MLLRKVKPNGWYGFRTRKTLSDPKVWYEVNAVVGGDLVLAGAALALTSILTWDAGLMNLNQVAYLHLAVIALGVGGSTIHGLLALRRMGSH